VAQGRVWTTVSWASVGRWARRLRRVGPVTVLVLVASSVASTPVPAAAAPPALPAGVTLTPPVQVKGSATVPASVSTEVSQGARGPGVPVPPPAPAVPSFPITVARTPRTSGDGGPPVPAAAQAPVDGSGSLSAGPGVAGAVEDVSARTPYAADFGNPDGSRTRRVYADVAFAPDAANRLQPVDYRLAATAVGGWLAPAVSMSQASFAPSSDGTDVARLDMGDGVSVGFGVAGSATVPVVVDGTVARYANVRPASDLQLSASTFGLKDELVLHSAAAPTSWLFPLRTVGVTPAWDQVSGSVKFTDRHGNVVAVIPPGLMQDSSFDARTGSPARSINVVYTLVPQGTGWALRVDLDAAWLADAARVWPVIVDPPLSGQGASDADDTFVSSRDYANHNNSAMTELLVGTYDGGGEKSEAFLNFNAAVAGMAGKYIYSADVAIFNEWSYSCTAADVSMHTVTQAWAGATTTAWPGPTFDSSPTSAPLTVAYGHTSCAAGAWIKFGIDGPRATAWAQGLEPFYGFTLQASTTNSTGWKRFYSNNQGASSGPTLEYNYDNGPTYLNGVSPTPGGTVDSLTPTLSANYFDPNPDGHQYMFQVCMGTPAAPVGCHQSPWMYTATYSVPAGWLTGWGQSWFWQVKISNNYSASGWIGYFTSTTQVPQPGVSAHLAGAPEGSEMPGVNPQPGNYATTVTDASVAVVGPALTLIRSYNSQDLRTGGAFGAGWSTPWDQKIVLEPDGTGNAVVTLATGLVTRFGENADGTYTAPAGQNLTLTFTAASSLWTLRDPSGTVRTYTAAGTIWRLSSVTDADGRVQNYTYDGFNHLSTVTDARSARALHVTWTGTGSSDHIFTVATDPPGGGQPTPTWVYSYTGNTLTAVCGPLGAGNCTSSAYLTSYGYTSSSSQYRSVVLDDNPVGYWPLDEASGTTAANLAARTPGTGDGTYSGVTLGATGALTGSTDTAATFGGTSAVTLPSGMISSSVGLAEEIWFKAASGASGILVGEQSVALPATPTNDWAPSLYIGTDGKLRGFFWTYAGPWTPITTSGSVTNNTWHHAVLSGNADHQELYLDGTLIGSITGQTIYHLNMTYTTIGNGYANGWPSANTGYFPFTGQLDEAAFYQHPLDQTQVSAHYAARTSSTKLTTVAEPGQPGPFTATTVNYNSATGRVNTLIDRNGATWTLDVPTIQSDGRHVSLHSNAYAPPSDTVTYVYDPANAGRVISRTSDTGSGPHSQTRTYDPTTGFLASLTDENNNVQTFGTDARGNVTAHTTCRGVGSPATGCHTEYAHYYINTANALDPANDVQDWASDARSVDANDTTYRTTNTLDAFGRVTFISYPKPSGQSVNPSASFVYSDGTTPAGIPPGLLTTATDRSHQVTQYTYTPQGDRWTTTDPVGLVTTNQYDAVGRPTWVNLSSTASGSFVDYGTTTTTYTANSQPWVITSPTIVNPVTGVSHRAVTTNLYDTMGRPTSQQISDSVGGDLTRSTTWVYDPAARIKTTTNPDGAITAQTWNTAGDQNTTTLPSGLVLNQTFDNAHRVTKVTATGANVDPEVPAATSLDIETRSYDPAGRLTLLKDGENRVSHLTYFGDGLPATTIVDLTVPTVRSITTHNRAYDAAGHLTSDATATGTRNSTSTYDPAGNLVTQTVDPGGLNRATTNSYNADNTVASTTVSGAATTSYGYDTAGRVLTTTTDPGGLGLVTTLVRDPRGLITRNTDATGLVTDYSYDLAGQLVNTTEAARTVWVAGTSTAGIQPVTTLGRDTFGDITQQRDPNLNVTTTEYDKMSRPTKVAMPVYTPPGGSPITAMTTTVYDTGVGKPYTVTDSANNTTTYLYDKYGNLTKRTQPDPDGAGLKTAPVWTYKYDDDSELLDTKDPAGDHTSSTYDELGRVYLSTQSDSSTGTTLYFNTTLGYDDAGNLTSSTSPTGYMTTTAYNAANQPTKVTDPEGFFAATGYDPAGRPASTVRGKGSSYANPVTTTGYDLAGRATSTSDCTANPSTGACATVQRTSLTTYDNAGRIIQTTSAEGRPTFYGYTAGLLTSVTQRVIPATPGTAISVSLGYDRAGNKTRMVDGNANATDYTYNTWNLPESIIEPATTAQPNAVDRTWTTSYNSLGLSTQDTLPGGITRTRSFDNLGRLTAETGTGATTTARSLDYDPDSRVTAATSPAGNLSFSWTGRNQLNTASGYGGATTYTYDYDNRLTNRSDGAGAATFGYDHAGRVTSVTDPLTSTTATLGYDTAGRPSTVGYGTGNASRAYTYDTLGRVYTDTMTKPGGGPAASITYLYYDDNLLKTKTTTGVGGAGANTYSYDGLARVTSWLNPGGTTTSYNYDNASNRTHVITPAGDRTSTYDQRNRITATTGASQPADSYTWNPRGQLTAATKNSQALTYTYDAFERLTQATKPGITVNFSYDSLDRAAQRNTANFGYNDLTNNPVVSPAALGETKLLRDPLGAALASKTGSTGTVLFADTRHSDIDANLDPTTGNLGPSTDYDPWGAPAASGPAPLGFQGGYTDPDIGLINAHARWYDPTLGGFTSRDTLTLTPNPIAQTNRYLYANASPLNSQDPSGSRATCDTDGGGTHSCTTNELKASGYDTTRHIDPAYAQGGYKRDDHAGQCGTGCGMLKSVVYAKTYANGTVLREYADGTVAIDGFAIPNARATMNPDDLAARVDYWKAHNGLLAGADAETQTAHLILLANKQAITKPGTKDIPPIELPMDLVAAASYDAAAAANGKAPVNPFTVAAAAATALCTGNPACYGGGKIDGKQAGGSGGSDDEPQSAPRTDANGKPLPNLHGYGAEDLNEESIGACSFTANTLVLLADGTHKPISNLRPGDHVAATDPHTGHTTTEGITATHINHDTDLADITVGTPSQTSTIYTTQNHPFWDLTTNAWVPAGQLNAGDALLSSDGTSIRVVGVRPVTGEQTMYNLTIADTHTYYVIAGDTPVLVHNDGGYTPGDIDLVQQHLATLDPSGANDQMIARIRGNIANGQPLSGAQVNFMEHELLEKSLMDGGMGYKAAHTEALKVHPAGQNYDIDIIDNDPSFGPWWRAKNGLPPRTC
jgi:RHS repeat-associated protein